MKPHAIVAAPVYAAGARKEIVSVGLKLLLLPETQSGSMASQTLRRRSI